MSLFLLFACGEIQAQAKKVQRAAIAAKEEAARPKVQCDGTFDTEPPHGCISGEIHCGDVIDGTTVGGDSNWDDDFYSGAFCFTAGLRHSASERVYDLKVPAHTAVDIRMDSDCVDLDVAAAAWKYEGSCPDTHHTIPECEGDTDKGGGRIHLEVFNPREFLVAVDGKNGATGPFRLTVVCGPLAH